MTFLRVAWVALVLMSAWPLAAASRGHRFREGVAALFQKYQVPAISAAVFSPAGLEAAEAFGVRRIGDGASVELSDSFYLASNTKPITATVAATLVEGKRITWNTTPADVWPSRAKRMDPQLRRVTLAQLLSHTAGIQPFTQDAELPGVPQFAGPPAAQRRAFAEWVLAKPPASAIGKFTYSNGSFGIAAAMLETVAGKSWEDLVRERVFQPLGMTSCGFGWPALGADQPHPHQLIDGRYVPGPEGGTGALPPWGAPAADVHCSAVDLGRFGQAHLLGMLGQRSLLRTGTYKAMQGPAEGYFLGWNRDEAGYAHRGGVTHGWHSFIFVSPSQRIAVAVSVNARKTGVTDELMTEVIQLAFDLFGGPANR